MSTIWTIVEEAGGRNAAASVRIENPPFQRLVIEMLPECGPDGHRAISIAHYGESNGDLMRTRKYALRLWSKRVILCSGRIPSGTTLSASGR